MTLELYIDGNLMASSSITSTSAGEGVSYTGLSVAYDGVVSTIAVQLDVNVIVHDEYVERFVVVTSAEDPSLSVPTMVYLPPGTSLDKLEVETDGSVSSQARSEQGEGQFGADVLAFLLGHYEVWYDDPSANLPPVTLRIYVLGPTSGSGSGSSSGSGSGSGYECPLRIVVAWDSGTGCNLPVRDGCYLLTVEEAP